MFILKQLLGILSSFIFYNVGAVINVIGQILYPIIPFFIKAKINYISKFLLDISYDIEVWCDIFYMNRSGEDDNV